MPLSPSRDFLQKVGLGEGLLDLPTDELFLRKKRTNPDQTVTSHPISPTGYSSARSFSNGFESDGRTKEILMPQVVNGFVLTPNDATKWMLKTKRHFGTYDTPEHADYAGQRLHELEALHDELLQIGRSRR
jgi:hypothetical protein